MTKIERQIINNQIALINYFQKSSITSGVEEQIELFNVKKESEELLRQDDEYRKQSKKINEKNLHDQFTKGKRLLDEYHKAKDKQTETIGEIVDKEIKINEKQNNGRYIF